LRLCQRGGDGVGCVCHSVSPDVCLLTVAQECATMQ